MQQCVKSGIDVLRKKAVKVFKLVIYIRIGKWPTDEITMIALIFFRISEAYNMDQLILGTLPYFLAKHVKLT